MTIAGIRLMAMARVLNDAPIEKLVEPFSKDGELKGSDATLYLRASNAVRRFCDTECGSTFCSVCSAQKPFADFAAVTVSGSFYFATCNTCLATGGEVDGEPV